MWNNDLMIYLAVIPDKKLPKYTAMISLCQVTTIVIYNRNETYASKTKLVVFSVYGSCSLHIFITFKYMKDTIR